MRRFATAAMGAAVLAACLTTNAPVRADDAPPSSAAPPQAAEPPAVTETPAPAPSAAVPVPAAPPAPSVQTVAPEAAEAILGRRVTDTAGKDLGRLVDVLVDENGQPQAAVIDFGGFMGVGNRKVAVHWSALRFTPSDPKHRIELEMTPDQIKTAPEYLNTDRAAPVVTPADAAPAPK